MEKFYIHETFQAEITLVREIEAENAAEARMESAAGEIVGAYIGEELCGTPIEIDVFERAKHNLPWPLFVPEKQESHERDGCDCGGYDCRLS